MTWTPEAIKKLQSELGDSNAEFAARIGATERTVENWRGGQRTPRARIYLRRLKRLVEGLKE
jgi:DNA-binding transcriptional regulator YiaG